MIALTDNIWKELKGGYRHLYDASVPLSKLEISNDHDEIEELFAELFDELHHQGDVDLASYLALPHIVRIGISKNLYNWNVLGLCAVIEIQRHAPGNPALPLPLLASYLEGLAKLKEFVLARFNYEKDDEIFRVSLSILALCSGRLKLGKALLEMDDELLDEFLDQF